MGSLLAIFLAKRGFSIAVYEKRPDMRKSSLAAGRSINLVISDRGWKALRAAGVEGDIELITPPNAEMGDLSFACFEFAKTKGRKPNEVAEELVSNMKKLSVVTTVKAIGPYVNFFLI